MRNAWATVLDVNEFDVGINPNRYRYVYALFSTSGFTPEAAQPATHSTSRTGQLGVIERYLTTRDTSAYGPVARARAVVIDEYRRHSWHIEPAVGPGWELTCRHGANSLRVVARPSNQVTLGKAEIGAANHPDWRLIVVDGSSAITSGTPRHSPVRAVVRTAAVR